MIHEEQDAGAYMLAEAQPTGKTRQLKCHYCGKAFPNMAALAGHIRAHKQASRIDSQAAILGALERQAAALEAIARELSAIRQTLAGLSISETRLVEKRVISAAKTEQPSEGEAILPAKQLGVEKPSNKLPSFLADNPWVTILSRRGREP
jgi:hypothetical protein